jgi:hypothetical protein
VRIGEWCGESSSGGVTHTIGEFCSGGQRHGPHRPNGLREREWEGGEEQRGNGSALPGEARVASSCLPTSFLIAAMVGGGGIVFLLGVNATQLFAHLRETQSARSLGKWAWGLSVVALLVPYFAPIALTMGAIDYRRPRVGEQSRAVLRPARMALLNSSWALVTILGVLAIMVGTGMLGARH